MSVLDTGKSPNQRQCSLPTVLLTGGLFLLGIAWAQSQTTLAQSAPPAPELELTSQPLPGVATRIELVLPLPERSLPNESGPVPAVRPSTSDWHEIIVKRGDTLASIFSRKQIYGDLGAVMDSDDEAKALKAIHPGQTIRLRIDQVGLQELIYEPNALEQLQLSRVEERFTAKHIVRPLETRHATASGTIKHSLFLAGRKAGLSDQLILDLAEIFGWDIDFALDIREGDRFTVLYEEEFLDGEKLRDGEIIAAEFVKQGTAYRAFRYTDVQGHTDYYAPDGRSMRKQFLRTPVSIARISSRFNLKRRHPILNRIRAHRGVDYAAARGTPIKATANGKVIFRGRKGGYGKTVILKHGTQYTTLYAHLSRYATKTGLGSRIQQGQTIGYIGSTGLATGPHLHYEFRVNGVHRDPLRVKLPKASALPPTELASFALQTESLITQLDLLNQTHLALNGDDTPAVVEDARNAGLEPETTSGKQQEG